MPVATPLINQDDEYLALETSSQPVQALQKKSAIEFAATRRTMKSGSQRVRGPLEADDDVIPAGSYYDESTGGATTCLLEASKFGQAIPLTDEDLADEAGYADAVNDYGTGWANSHAVKLDNACLGVTGGPGVAETTVPFTSVYYSIHHTDSDFDYTADDNLDTTTRAAMATDGDGFGLLNDFWALWEASPHYDDSNAIVIAHPTWRTVLRSVKNSNGDPIFTQGGTQISSSLPGVLTRSVDTINQVPVLWSTGARMHATASAAPTGHELLIVGNRQHLLLGVRSGPETKEERVPMKDVTALMFRSRRGFKLFDPRAAAVFELTA